MHSVLSDHINATIATAASLERHEERISQVLGILSDPSVTELAIIGGGCTAPFISATVAQGEPEAAIMAALASVGISEVRDSDRENGNIWRHCGNVPDTGVMVFLDVRRRKREIGRQHHEDGTIGIDYADGSYEEFPPSCRHLVPA